MDVLDTTVNNSTVNNSHTYITIYEKIISDELRLIIQVVNYVFLCTFITLFGMFSNIINVIVFYKQGLNSSINVTFFAMAISDLCGLVTQLWVNICINPLFESADVPMVPSEFQYLTGGTPRVVFSKITCLITVYATLERCLCIAFPLHIKQMITPRRTAIVMSLIYGLIFMSIVPVYCTTSIGWKLYPDRNKTLLGLIFAKNTDKLSEIFFILQAIIGVASFVAVVLFTAILIRKLGQKSTWRQAANMDQAKSESMSNRDRKTMSMVVLIASILIVCYTPGIFLCSANFFEPEFSVMGRYSDVLWVTWSFGLLFETINSSVNMFLYFKMSTKYRDTFNEVFIICRKLEPSKKIHLGRLQNKSK